MSGSVLGRGLLALLGGLGAISGGLSNSERAEWTHEAQSAQGGS
jgi:hypothetical protein